MNTGEFANYVKCVEPQARKSNLGVASLAFSFCGIAEVFYIL